MKNIILTGGGTAGHVTPHLALANDLKKNFDDIYYVGSGKEIERELMQTTGAIIYNVDSPAFIRSLTLKNLKIPFKLIKAIKQSQEIIKKCKPSVVFSKGGYGALPICLAAFKLKIPVICHESDLSLGLANKLCAKKAKALLTTFEETSKEYANGVYVGPIIRKEFFEKRKEESKRILGINNDKPSLLVTGGSQGSEIINNVLKANLSLLLPRFNVIHLHGKKNKPIYESINGYFPFSFTDMPTVISACDICLSRGGSNTLFELLATKTPSLIVPLIKGSRGDQVKNARYFASKGALLYCNENHLEEKFIELIDELFSKRNILKEKMQKLNFESGKKKTLELLLKFAK